MSTVYAQSNLLWFRESLETISNPAEFLTSFESNPFEGFENLFEQLEGISASSSEISEAEVLVLLNDFEANLSNPPQHDIEMAECR